MSRASVEITGLSHRFGDLDVLDSLSLAVPAGGFTALIGPTGCGKSTVLRVLAGLLRPTAGAATIGGESTLAPTTNAAYMPQRDTLLPWRTALANATLGTEIRGDRSSTPRAEELFARFGLAGFERSLPRTLSGGMRQRVALLRTVLTDTPVMLLDEPFGSLDAITRLDLHGWLAELLLASPRTVVLVTHDIDEALRLADEVVVFSPRPGRVVDTLPLEPRAPGRVRDVTTPEGSQAKRRLMAALGAR